LELKQIIVKGNIEGQAFQLEEVKKKNAMKEKGEDHAGASATWVE